ncbi:kinase suppressor of Ras 2-like isoform X2 [Ptychodera flava]|uniref:kinase suppressor of Ras 2-like isoform X2 n=1 Tax=Ptychodera flava TaxID=63121 RepID=UPI00396AB165
MSEEDITPERVLDQCRTIQTVIDSRLDSLAGLRTQCENTSVTIKREIREAENKLLELFCKQLSFKSRCQHNGEASPDLDNLQRYPSLAKWLTVVDINQNTAQGVCSRVGKLESLLEFSDSDIIRLLSHHGGEEKEATRLILALKALKRFLLAISQGDNMRDIPLPHWDPDGGLEDSPPEPSSSPRQPRPSTSSIPLDLLDNHAIPPSTPPPFVNESHPAALWRVTPPPTPTMKKEKGGKLPSKGTPPPHKKLAVPDPVLKRSKSDDAALGHRINLGIDPKHGKKPNNLKMLPGPYGSHEVLTKRRMSVESDSDAGATCSSGHSSPRRRSPARTPPTPHHHIESKDDLLARSHATLPNRPKSPRTPSKSMVHKIKHRFAKKNFFFPQKCDFCNENLMFKGFKCKECKYICHIKCEEDAKKLPSCGLPTEFEKVFRQEMTSQASRSTSEPPIHPMNNNPSVKVLSPNENFSYLAESSSNPSSTTSSTPSSPAPIVSSMSSLSPQSPAQASPLNQSPAHSVPVPLARQTHFDFPEVQPNHVQSEILTPTPMYITIECPGDFTDGGVDTDSERTLPSKVDSIDSQASDIDLDQRRPGILSEWDIPYEELNIQELIGTGRLGKVYKGYWHGDVAIKLFNVDTDNELQWKSFKQEVSTFRKTRHENLVLFMGACMNPSHLAIVTSLCKGSTLYSQIHIWKETFLLHKSVLIATQIAQGMGYLHARGIVHKDLKSKNIFLETRDKAVITDFGLFSVTKSSENDRGGDSIRIPEGWLCYLAPELITSLKITELGLDNQLPFSKASDVYAYGTIWYELLAGEWTFNNQPVESIIWKVGKGIKQSLGHLQASRDVKDILMMCWSYKPESRPTFSELMKTLDRLPKKRLTRSPSHPLHLSRSAESVL